MTIWKIGMLAFGEVTDSATSSPYEQSLSAQSPRPQKAPRSAHAVNLQDSRSAALTECRGGQVADVFRLIPRPNYRHQLVFPRNFFPSDAKKPHKSMIYRASSINMAPDVGIEPTTHWLTESRVTFHVRVSLRKLTCLFCKPSTRSR